MSFAGAERMRPGVTVTEVDISERIPTFPQEDMEYFRTSVARAMNIPTANGRVYTMDMDIASMYPRMVGIDQANMNPSFSVSSRGYQRLDGSLEIVEWSMVNPCAEIALEGSDVCNLGRPTDHFENEEELFEI